MVPKSGWLFCFGSPIVLGIRNPAFRNSYPKRFSRGMLTWQVEQSNPSLRVKFGIALAWNEAAQSAKATRMRAVLMVNLPCTSRYVSETDRG